VVRRAEFKLGPRLGARLREERNARGWTQEQAAEQCGYGIRHYQKIEGAELNIKLSTLEKLAEKFGVHPSDLLRKR
jgi:transcriptional regulator with XRE-family HTH domain